MKILVVAEHINGKLNEATLNTLGAAVQLASFGTEAQIDLLVAGSEIAKVAEQACQLEHVNAVLSVDAPQYHGQLAENMSLLAVNLVQERGYQAVICSNTTVGKNLSPRIAALLDVAQISEVIAINGLGEYKRPIYAGNIEVTVHSQEPVQVLTVRTTSFDKVGHSGNAELVSLEAGADQEGSRFIDLAVVQSDRPELSSASIVVSGGRGLGSEENYQQLMVPLADSLGAALGASRAAVDAGYVSNDYQVGQTGKIVAPDLYIAVGISGAIQHLAGMSGSKTVVAINKDPDAPIFQCADYCLEGDLFELVPELTAALA